jgi:hypothetical protein
MVRNCSLRYQLPNFGMTVMCDIKTFLWQRRVLIGFEMRCDQAYIGSLPNRQITISCKRKYCPTLGLPHWPHPSITLSPSGAASTSFLSKSTTSMGHLAIVLPQIELSRTKMIRIFRGSCEAWPRGMDVLRPALTRRC